MLKSGIADSIAIVSYDRLRDLSAHLAALTLPRQAGDAARVEQGVLVRPACLCG